MIRLRLLDCGIYTVHTDGVQFVVKRGPGKFEQYSDKRTVDLRFHVYSLELIPRVPSFLLFDGDKFEALLV